MPGEQGGHRAVAAVEIHRGNGDWVQHCGCGGRAGAGDFGFERAGIWDEYGGPIHLVAHSGAVSPREAAFGKCACGRVGEVAGFLLLAYAAGRAGWQIAGAGWVWSNRATSRRDWGGVRNASAGQRSTW